MLRSPAPRKQASWTQASQSRMFPSRTPAIRTLTISQARDAFRRCNRAVRGAPPAERGCPRRPDDDKKTEGVRAGGSLAALKRYPQKLCENAYNVPVVGKAKKKHICCLSKLVTMAKRFRSKSHGPRHLRIDYVESSLRKKVRNGF